MRLRGDNKNHEECYLIAVSALYTQAASIASRSHKSTHVQALSSVSSSDSANIVIDSGASNTFMNPKIPLFNIRKTTPVVVALANSQTLEINTSATLKDYPVLVSPSFKNSLFSVGEFCGDSSLVYE